MHSHMFFFDIDGTLLFCPAGKTDLDDSTYQTLKKLRENYPICLASGRTLSYLPDHLLSIGFDGMVLANGAYVYYQGKVIREDYLESKEVEEIVAYCQAHEIEYVLEGTEAYYAPATYTKMQAFFDKFDLPKHKRADKPIERVTKIAVICHDEKTASQFDRDFQKRYRLMAHGGYSYDLYPHSQSKARGIADLVKMADRTMDDVVAFGDGFNDLEMIEEAGIGIAMGNASGTLKEKADFVTTTVLEQGVVHALQHFNWVPKG